MHVQYSKNLFDSKEKKYENVSIRKKLNLVITKSHSIAIPWKFSPLLACEEW